jgi:hypothetical protein
MKNTEKNPKQPKVLIDVMSKTIDNLTKNLYLKELLTQYLTTTSIFC